jgi:hypothetical protein
VGHDALQQLVLDALLHDQPRRGRAVLAHVPEGTVDDMGGDAIQVFGVVQHHGGVLAAHFKGDFLEVRLGGVAQEAAAGFGAAGEADRVDVHVPPDGFPHLRPGAGDDVEDARRDAGFHRQFGHAQGGEGVSSAGFTMTEQPAASAGPIFQASISSGKFQGSTRPTTPTGSRTIMAIWLSDAGATWS